MLLSARPFAALVALSMVLAPVSGLAGDLAGEAYHTAVEARCPDKNLEWLNPGYLVDGMTNWVESLPPTDRKKVEKHAAPALAKCEVGAGCVNAAYIGAAEAFGLEDGLAEKVCALPYRCTEPFTCQ